MSNWNVPFDVKNRLSVGSDANVHKILDRMIKHFHRVDRPVHAGSLAVDVGVSLRQLTLLLVVLLDSGRIKKLVDPEALRSFGVDPTVDPEVYVLTSSAEIGLAYD